MKQRECTDLVHSFYLKNDTSHSVSSVREHGMDRICKGYASIDDSVYQFIREETVLERTTRFALGASED